MALSQPLAGRGPVEAPLRSTATSALEALSLVLDFGAMRAVDGVSFRVRSGSLLTLFGPNGAGKTTVLRMLAGSLKPTAGEVILQGERREPGSIEWRRRIGVLSHQSFLYPRLTASENLRFYGKLYGLDDLDDRIRERLDRVDLGDRADSLVGGFSRGMKQRLALARTLLHDPEVVLLDEPYTGLDAHAAALLNDVLVALKDGRRTVVLVTHNLAQGLELADDVAVLVRGRVAHLSPKSELPQTRFESFYRTTVEGGA